MRARQLFVVLSVLLGTAACGARVESIPVLPAAAPAPAGPETGTVAHVDDGDTFTLTDGRTVHVLGIDACDGGTRPGRAATAEATALIDGEVVTLEREPGTDRDPAGRVLRYVTVPDGRDLGTILVARPHTGVDPGGAAAVYLAALRAVDDGPRACGGPTAAPRTTTAAPQPVRAAVPRTTAAPKPSPAPAPVPVPKPKPAPQQAAGAGCHPSYDPCVPAGPDLDCPDIGHSVRVIGPDSFRLDADKDGIGCE